MDKLNVHGSEYRINGIGSIEVEGFPVFADGEN
jgi:hypothetical protein